MLSPASRSRTSVNIWPGFVDMLASVLLVFIFMLLIFVVAQFFLADLASNRYGAIDQLSTNIHALLDELSVEKEQRAALQDDLDATRRRRGELESTVASLMASARTREQALAAEQERRSTLQAQLLEQAERERSEIRVRDERIDEQAANLDQAQRMSAEASAQVLLLNQQLADLRQRITRLSSALEVSETSNASYKVEVEELGAKLNLALAERVEELNRFRSDFFGRMREVLGDRDDIQISGDRFVFQSELLFASGSADLEAAGRVQLDRLAQTLRSVAEQIPPDVDWILRVDGHTDRRPIRTSSFPSNWELSTARALSIVRHLIERGIEPRRLAAAGFGEFRPLDGGDTPQALARNRRIEIKVTGP